MCSDESVVILLLYENRGSCTIFIFFNILTNISLVTKYFLL